MIKLTNILSELQVAPQGITVEKVKEYFIHNMSFSNNDDNLWLEYKQLSTPYLKKYKIFKYWIGYDEFEKLSKPDLIKLYNQMRALVRKYYIE